MTQTDLTAWILAVTLVSSAIAIGALGLRRLLRDHVARYRLDCVALVCMVLTPALLFVFPHARPVASVSASTVLLVPGAEPAWPITAEGTAAASPGRLDALRPVASGAAATGQRLVSTLAPAYVLVAGCLVGLAGIRLVLSARQLARSRVIGCGRLRAAWQRMASDTPLGRHVLLLESDTLTTPVSWSLTRPAIHLPTGLGEQPDELIDCVLAHELVHLRRHDQLTLLLQHLLLAVTWASPFTWWFHRVMCDDRELSCDEFVVRRHDARHSYAQALLLFGTGQRRSVNQTLVALRGRGRTQLTRRIHMLSRTPTSPSRLPIQLGLGAALVLLASVGAGTVASALPAASSEAASTTPTGILIMAPVIDERARLMHPTFGPLSSTNETVVSAVGTQLDARTIVANEVTVNLPENSRLQAVASGSSFRFAPGTVGVFEITDGSIAIAEQSGPHRIRVTARSDGAILRLTSEIALDEYTFSVSASDADGRPVAIEVKMSLPDNDEGQSEADESLSWYVTTPGEDEVGYRIRLTRQIDLDRP